MFEEGYECDTVQELSNDLYCVICLKLMRNPVQFKCGHGMCFSCYKRLQNRYQQRCGDAQCPQCREIIKDNQVVSNIMLHRFILSLMVQCSNNHHGGCQWIGELSLLEEHVENCTSQDSVNVSLLQPTVLERPENDQTPLNNDVILLQRITELLNKLDDVNIKSKVTQHQQNNNIKKKKIIQVTNSNINIQSNIVLKNKLLFLFFFIAVVLIIYVCIGKLFSVFHNDNVTMGTDTDQSIRFDDVDKNDSVFMHSDKLHPSEEEKWKSLYELLEIKFKWHLLELKMESDLTLNELSLSNNEKLKALENLESLIMNDIQLTTIEINKSISKYDESAFQSGVIKDLNVLQENFRKMSENLNKTIADRLLLFEKSWLELEKQLSHKLLLKIQNIKTQVRYIADYNVSGNCYAKELKDLQREYMTYQHQLTNISKSLDQYIFINKMEQVTRNLTNTYSTIFTNYVQNTTQKLSYTPRFQMLLYNLYHQKNPHGVYIWDVNVTYLTQVSKKHMLQSKSFQISKNNSAELMVNRGRNRNWKLTYKQLSGYPKMLHISIYSQIKEEILLLKKLPYIQEVFKHGYQKVFIFPFTFKQMKKRGFISDDNFIVRCFVLDDVP